MTSLLRLPRLTEKAARGYLVSGVLALALAAYLPSLGGGFFSDDHAYIIENQELRSIPLAQGWRLFFSRTNPFEFLPVRDLSYRLDLDIFGLDPLGYRLHNLFLYALCCVAFWLCARSCAEVLAKGRGGPESRASLDWIATTAMALFAAHPAHVESVAWISGRKDLLSGLFGLLSLWLFAEALMTPNRRRLAYVASLSAFLVALLSKSGVVTLPAFFFLLVLITPPNPEGFCSRLAQAARWILPFVLVAAGALVLHLLVARETEVLQVITAPPAGVAASQPLKALLILGYLSQIALLPLGLRLIYDVGAPGSAQVAAFLVGALTLVASIWATRALRVRTSLVPLGIILFASLAIPYLQIIPFRTWSLASERFLFLPIGGLAISAAGLVQRSRHRHRMEVFLALVFLLMLAVTFQRSRIWASNEALFISNARYAPENHLAASAVIISALLPAQEYDRAIEAAHQVRNPQARDVLESYVAARRALDTGHQEKAVSLTAGLTERVTWRDPILQLQLANLALEAGLPHEAAIAYEAVLEERPYNAGVLYNLGLTYKRLGRLADSEIQFVASIEAGISAAAEAHNQLALIQLGLNRPADAEVSFRNALAADPHQWHAAYNLARLHLQQGRTSSAHEILREAKRRAAATREDATPVNELLDLIEGGVTEGPP